MSFSNAMAQLITTIQAVTPAVDPDLPFVFDEDGDGHVSPLEDLAGARHRACDLRVLTYPTDDGESGLTTLRFRARVGLRVLYVAERDRATLERAIAEDTALLVQAILDIAAWDPAVVSIPPPGPPTVEERLGGNPIPQRLGFVLTIPFDLVYLSAGP